MKKIKLKTLYLIGIITIGLIGLGIGSTYAMFTTSIEIDNPISLSTTLTSESDVIETFDVEVAAGGNKEIPLTINNTSNTKLNYSVWYITSASDIEMGTKLSNSDSSPSSSTIASGETKKVYIQIKNNSTSSITVTLGVSSSTSNVVLSSSMTMVPNAELMFGKNLLEYINNLYSSSTKTTVTNNSKTYNYATSVNLMNDRLGGTTTSLDGGNIRYYGSDANNYIYFNCSDYSNQNAETCELWRIIGVFDGKVKIMRNDPIEELARDRTQSSSSKSSNANWTTSSINTFLNNSYYNGDTAGIVTYYSTDTASRSKSLDMSKIGLKNDITRNMISESTWRIGYGASGYADVIYNKEESTYSKYSSTWTGKIALLNVSDYNYAMDFSKCTYASGDSSYTAPTCTSNNWMHSVITSDAWTLDIPVMSSTSNSYFIASNGTSSFISPYETKAIFPVLNLDTEVLVNGKGLGSYKNPFKIIPDGVSLKSDNNDDSYLVNHIVNLYDNANKTEVANNSITYNYATSVNLMNDRNGNLSTPLNDGNIRYYGASPNNYIYFNCSDYSNQNAETCELWRIIGVFDGKVKIIRNTSIEELARDRKQSSSSTSYNANWSTSSVNTLLNSSYYNGNGVVTYYSTDTASRSKSLDMSKIGLKNDITRNMVSESTWRIGYGASGYADVVYKKEDSTYSTYSSKWIGKIALLNVSDYNYAMDFSKCTYASSDSSYTAPNCTSNNWMLSIITSDTWTLDIPVMSSTSNSYFIASNGTSSFISPYETKAIFPVLNLKLDVMISKKTTGEYRNPYKILPSGTTLSDSDNTLEKYIVNLYDSASKTTTSNNSITYNYATSESLMSDRKGNSSTPLNDGNIRYYGASPNNYIYFNCSDYSNQNADTCEVWRIIGVFDGKVKIIRSTSIEELARDRTQSSSSTSYNANWTTSSINTLLNKSYYNGDTAGVVTYYSTKTANKTKTLDMSKIGLKNDTTRNMISESTWRIGYGASGYADVVYKKEDSTYSTYSSKWIGKIALLNVSDYNYAMDFSKCTYASSDSSYTAPNCTSNNWMLSIITSDTWTLDIPVMSSTSNSYFIASNGTSSFISPYETKAIFPVLNLKTLTKLKGGFGTSSNPYQLQE